MDVYLVDPGSVTLHLVAAWCMLIAMTVIGGLLAFCLGWRSWPVILLSVLLVPTGLSLCFGGRVEFSMLFLTEVLLPLSLFMGAPAAAVGGAAGSGLRWWWRRHVVRG
jgi:hypothetical protein